MIKKTMSSSERGNQNKESTTLKNIINKKNEKQTIQMTENGTSQESEEENTLSTSSTAATLTADRESRDVMNTSRHPQGETDLNDHQNQPAAMATNVGRANQMTRRTPAADRIAITGQTDMTNEVISPSDLIAVLSHQNNSFNRDGFTEKKRSNRVEMLSKLDQLHRLLILSGDKIDLQKTFHELAVQIDQKKDRHRSFFIDMSAGATIHQIKTTTNPAFSEFTNMDLLSQSKAIQKELAGYQFHLHGGTKIANRVRLLFGLEYQKLYKQIAI